MRKPPQSASDRSQTNGAAWQANVGGAVVALAGEEIYAVVATKFGKACFQR